MTNDADCGERLIILCRIPPAIIGVVLRTITTYHKKGFSFKSLISQAQGAYGPCKVDHLILA